MQKSIIEYPKCINSIYQHLRTNQDSENLNRIFNDLNKLIERFNLNNKILMTDQQIIDVVTAHKAGKTIEFRPKCEFETIWYPYNGDISWDFHRYEYRVKEEPKYRPYKNAKEFLNAQREHGPYIQYKYKDKSWYENGVTLFVIETITDTSVTIKTLDSLTFTKILNHNYFDFKWQDGTPLGILE